MVVRLSDLPEVIAQRALEKDCPQLVAGAWVVPPPLHRARVAIVSTAGVHLRGDEAFATLSTEYRVVPGDAGPGDVVMSHSSVNYDRSGFYRDVDVVFPLQRLRELEADGVIGSSARYHYAFNGAGLEPHLYERPAREVASHLRADAVDVVLLVPV